MNIKDFQSVVWDYYHDYGRDLPWRQTTDPYHILISEIMLQQTQVSRVIDKYQEFVSKWPTAAALARAQFNEVLAAWAGLGYNRRAKFLHDSAKMITHDWRGTIPVDLDKLQTLPGVGYNTAAAILVYSFNQPLVFIETNIRTVFIYHFFGDETKIHDNDLRVVIESALDKTNPCEWYWALMDYGSYLKKEVGNLSCNSFHYSKQSRFEGSKRQLRGRVLKSLLAGPMALTKLTHEFQDARMAAVLNDLEQDGLISTKKNLVRLAE